jgi:hypothetical protein
MTDVYGSAAAFRSYFDARGSDIPGTWDDPTVDAALLVASEWLDNIYGKMFSGWKTGGFDQDREWPRSTAWANTYPTHFFQSTDIPDRIKSAAYEAAFRQLTTPGSLMVDYKPGKYRSVSVEGAIRVEYNTSLSATDIQTQIGVIDSLLWPLLTGEGAGMSTLSGGSTR